MTFDAASGKYEYEDIALLHINKQQSQVLGFTELAASEKKISVS